jgi:uncharacterized metal-binding protein
MPGARTHDLITVVTGAALMPPAYAALATAYEPVQATGLVACFAGAHLVSGMLFSPDLDLDSAIDNRWGPFYWIWRPYMWLVPHRRFFSHSLVFSPLLRLLYFYLVVMGVLVGGAWLLGQAGVAVPYLHVVVTEQIFDVLRRYPDEVRAVLLGFITGSAAHTIADWLVTGGKRYLRLFGLRVRRDYSNHDRYVPRTRRRGGQARSY